MHDVRLSPGFALVKSYRATPPSLSASVTLPELTRLPGLSAWLVKAENAPSVARPPTAASTTSVRATFLVRSIASSSPGLLPMACNEGVNEPFRRHGAQPEYCQRSE